MFPYLLRLAPLSRQLSLVDRTHQLSSPHAPLVSVGHEAVPPGHNEDSVDANPHNSAGAAPADTPDGCMFAAVPQLVDSAKTTVCKYYRASSCTSLRLKRRKALNQIYGISVTLLGWPQLITSGEHTPFIFDER